MDAKLLLEEYSDRDLPFVLRFAEAVPSSYSPGFYDYENQIWVGPSDGRFTIRTSAPERTDEVDQGTNV